MKYLFLKHIMKKLQSILLITLLSVTTVFNSCSSSDDSTTQDSTTTVAEDQQNIEASMTQLLSCLQTFEDGAFSTELQDFFNIANGEIYSDYADLLLDRLDVFNIEFENFSFSSHVGVYAWNANTEVWDFTNSTDNTMVFLFPHDENSASNNVELAITSYASQTVTFDGENSELPTAFTGYIKKNNIELFNISLSNVVYEVNSNFSFPSNIDLSVTTAPFTHTINLSRNTSTEFDFTYGLQNNGSCVTSIMSTIVLNTSDYANIAGAEDFSHAFGTVLHQNFEVRYSVEIDNLAVIDGDITVSQINQFVNADAYYNNAKVGDLVYNEEADGSAFVTIIYQDGTSDNVTRYVGDDFVNQLETIFSAFIN